MLAVFAALLAARDASAQTDADLFDDTVVHEIRIDIRKDDWETLKKDYLGNAYYTCNFKWRDILVEDIAIRSRGTGSRSPIKPGLRVDFDYNVDDQKFLGLKSLVLRGNTQDPSMLHERLSMLLFRRMGILASRESNAKLFVNGEYIGLYTIVENVDKTFLKKNVSENDGYLYKYNYDAGDLPYYFEYKGADPNLYVDPVGPFKPETHEKDNDPKPIEAMVRTINQSPDADFQRLMADFLDVKLFLKHVAVERFLGEQDGVIGGFGMNNFYIYRFEKKNLFQLIAWDKSNAFEAFSNESIWRFITDVPAAQQNRLAQRVLKFPDLRNAYLESLAATARMAGGRNGLLSREVERQYQQTRPAALEDKNKQCQDPATGLLKPCSDAEFETAITHLKNFSKDRSAEVLSQVAADLTPSSERPFSMSDKGGGSVATVGDPGATVIGYARIQPASGKTTPAGVAIFGFRENGVVVTEAGVPASPLQQSGRIYAEIGGPTDTGIAIANPSSQSATISFYFTDANGKEFGQGTTTIPAGGQIAEFLDQSRFNAGSSLSGSFTFSSNVAVSAVALRSFKNERSETLITTLPVAALSEAESDTVVFPHFADGNGWTTQVVLVNPTDEEMRGTVDFYDQGSSSASGAPVAVTVDGKSAASFAYTVPARGARRLATSGSGKELKQGSVRAIPASGNKAPSGVAIFAYRFAGVTVTEAGVPASRASTAVRMYAEHSGESIYTALAVANTASSPVTVKCELTDLDGKATGPTGTFTVPANGQVALFLDQVPGLESLATPFQGLVRLTTTAATGISVVGLRGRVNERDDFLITTIPASDEKTAASTAERIFPHIVEAGGYTTQFILYSGAAGQATSGSLRFVSQSGDALKVKLW